MTAVGSHSEGLQTLLDSAVLLTWLLKDTGWVLLCLPLAWPAAAAALVLEVWLLRTLWPRETFAGRIQSSVVLLWLLGNVSWVIGEFLYSSEAAGKWLVWYPGPLVRESDEQYKVWTSIARVMFSVALAALLGCYFVCALSRSRRGQEDEQLQRRHGSAEPDSEQELIYGVLTPSVHQYLYMGPWLVKELSWTNDQLLPALVGASLAMLLTADCLVRYGDPSYGAQLLWIVGNTIWVCAELGFRDTTPVPRVLAGVVLAVAAAWAALLLLRDYKKHTAAQESTPSEETALSVVSKQTYT